MNIKCFPRLSIIILIVALIYNTSSAQTPVNRKAINFTTFTVCTKEDKVCINWATDNAEPTNYFEIQKSLDGKTFKTIALILGPDPKQNTGDHYGCFDKFIRKEIKHSLYRIKYITADGFVQLSDAKTVSKI